MVRPTIVETLLNTLEVERYVRGPLLLTLVDELTSSPGNESAARAAQRVVDGLASGTLAQTEFLSRLGEIRGLVRPSAASAASAASSRSGGFTASAA